MLLLRQQSNLSQALLEPHVHLEHKLTQMVAEAPATRRKCQAQAHPVLFHPPGRLGPIEALPQQVAVRVLEQLPLRIPPVAALWA